MVATAAAASEECQSERAKRFAQLNADATVNAAKTTLASRPSTGWTRRVQLLLPKSFWLNGSLNCKAKIQKNI